MDELTKKKLLSIAALLLAFALGVVFSYLYLRKPCPNVITSGKSSMTVSFNDLVKLVIPGATSKNVLVECYDSPASRKMIVPKSVAVDRDSNIIVLFSQRTSGYCIAHNTK